MLPALPCSIPSGIITQGDFYSFRDIYDEQHARIQEAIRKQEETMRILFKSGVSGGVRLEKFKEGGTLSGLF